MKTLHINDHAFQVYLHAKYLILNVKTDSEAVELCSLALMLLNDLVEDVKKILELYKVDKQIALKILQEKLQAQPQAQTIDVKQIQAIVEQIVKQYMSQLEQKITSIVNQLPKQTQQQQVQVQEEVEVPSFIKDNPWVQVLRRK